MSFKPWCLFTPIKYFLPEKQSTSLRAELTGCFSPHVTALTHCPAIVHHHQISICNPSFLWVHKTGHKGNKTSKKTVGQAEGLHPFCVSSDAVRQLCFPPEVHSISGLFRTIPSYLQEIVKLCHWVQFLYVFIHPFIHLSVQNQAHSDKTTDKRAQS